MVNLSDRTFLTLAAAGLISVGLGWIHPASVADTGVPQDKFWAQKTLEPAASDVVIGGDSRSMHGFSPDAMGAALANRRIFNFAFSATGLSPRYLEWLAGKLSRNSPEKMIIIGVTPNSLTPIANADNNFLSHIRANQADLRVDRYLGDVIHFFEPFSLNELIKYMKPGYRGSKEEIDRAYTRRYPNGWAKLQAVHPDMDASTKPYIKNFTNNPVSERIVSDFLDSVRRLSAEGVVVIGIRPPTTMALKNLENERGGFDEPKFSQRFEAAGGYWLAVPFETYQTVDGSHLEGKSAEKFSRDVAEQIKRLGPFPHQKQ